MPCEKNGSPTKTYYLPSTRKITGNIVLIETPLFFAEGLKRIFVRGKLS
jgi:hypothetical protein